MTTLASAIVESGAWASLTVLGMTFISSACGPAFARRREEAVRAHLAAPELAQSFAEALGLRGAGTHPPVIPAGHAGAAELSLVGATASSPDPRVLALAHPGNRARELGGGRTRIGVHVPTPIRVDPQRRWVA